MSDQTSQARIEADLRTTRERMAARLDDLTGRLSPGQILDEGLAYVRTEDGAEFMHNLRRQVRDNPMPVVMTGIGLAWLALGGGMRRNGAYRSQSHALVPYGENAADWQSSHHETADRARRAGEAVKQQAGETQEAFQHRVAEAQAKVMGLSREAQETASGFADRVRQALSQAAEKASEWSDHARARAHDASASASSMAGSGRDTAARAGQYASQAGSYASETSARLANALSGNPLLMSAVGMTAGALFGALLPPTEMEESYLGQAAGRAGEKARAMAGDLAERGAKVAQAAAQAGMDAAKDEGLTSGGAAGSNGQGSR